MWLQSSRPEIISMLGTQHYRQHWRRVSTLRAGKTNRVCSDLMFTSALRGWLVFVVFFTCFVCKPTACSLVWMPIVDWKEEGLEESGFVLRSTRLFPPPHFSEDMKGGCGPVRRVFTQSVLLYLLLCYSETRGGVSYIMHHSQWKSSRSLKLSQCFSFDAW